MLRRLIRDLWDLVVAGFAVATVISLIVWAVDGLESRHGLIAKSSLDGKLVLALLFALVATLVWGYRRGHPEGVGGHHYHGPVTQNYYGTPERPAPSPAPSDESKGEERAQQD